MRLGNIARRIAVTFGAIALTSMAACGGISGIYSNELAKIEFKSGGKAAVTIMGQSKDCTYVVDKKKVTVDCKEGDPLVLTLSDDETELKTPETSMMPALKKQK